MTVDRRLLPGSRPRTSTRSCARSSATAALRGGDDRARRRHALAVDTPLWDASRLGRDDRAGRGAGAALLGRLHRLPLDARGVRHGRVRLLPDADDGPGAGGAADPLRRRADPRRRPRARGRVPPRGGPLAGFTHASSSIRPRARSSGSRRTCASAASSRRAARSSRRTSSSATGSRSRCGGRPSPSPPEPCAACRSRPWPLRT